MQSTTNTVCPVPSATGTRQAVEFPSLGVMLQAVFVPVPDKPGAPVLIISHGAGDFKENYLEMADHLATQGVASLALDMHGHGASEGTPYNVRMQEWVPDIIAALDYLETRTDVDMNRIGAFGVSSGGTAILEAALQDSRLRALVTLDATVMNTLPFHLTVMMSLLSVAGHVKRLFTGKDLRISMLSMLDDVALVSDPEINEKLKVDPGKMRALMNFPLPGAAEAFFVNTIRRVHQIKVPTIVIWGEEDELDPVSTAHALYGALTCEKHLEIMSGSGHAGHLDRHKLKVFEFTARWLLKHLA